MTNTEEDGLSKPWRDMQEGDGWRMYLGDSVELLPTFSVGTFNAVVTDPPYGINTKSDGEGKLNPWADLCNAALWYSIWIREARRALTADGCLWSFLNWRSMVTFQKAACDIKWPIESLLVWDKQWIGPGGSRGLRPSYEMVALWSGPEFSIEDRGLPDIQRFQWSSFKPSGHPAEKPTELCKWLIQQSGATRVLDPFAGSGTTGIAALETGAMFTGIEIDEHWFRVACNRLRSATPCLFGAKT